MTWFELKQTAKAIGLVGCLMLVCIMLGLALSQTCAQPRAGQPAGEASPAGDPR